MSNPSRNPEGGATRARSFRLEPQVLADLDLIADHYGRETGVPHSRTDALRLAARREAERLRRARKRS